MTDDEFIEGLVEDIKVIRKVAGDIDVGEVLSSGLHRGNIGGVVSRACDRIEKAAAEYMAKHNQALKAENDGLRETVECIRTTLREALANHPEIPDSSGEGE